MQNRRSPESARTHRVPCGMDVGEAVPGIDVAQLAFTARKESWIAASSGRFYKMFRRSDDPVRDWLDPVCIERGRREHADMLFLHRIADRVCRPLGLDHACVAYPWLSGPDMRVMLRSRDTGAAERAAALRDAMVLLARMHTATRGTAAPYPAKDYLHAGYLVPDEQIARRIAQRERTIFIGGFEARNFRFDSREDGWYFFDPQHVFLGMPEDDLARFVISLLMLNWGKGGSLKLWQDFRLDDLVAIYEDAAARALDRVLLDYFLRETVAMRRHFAEKALRSMGGTRRILGRPYLAAYFLQLEQWVTNHEL